MRVIYRIAHEDIVLPDELRDGRLRKILARALARDTEQRYRSAADMYAELKNFRDAVDEPFAPEGGDAAAVQFLLRRMRLKSDFPALGMRSAPSIDSQRPIPKTSRHCPGRSSRISR